MQERELTTGLSERRKFEEEERAAAKATGGINTGL